MEEVTILSNLPPLIEPTTSMKMPQFGFGTSPIGDLFVNTPEAEIQQALDTAWKLGIRYFDTAPWYGRDRSDHCLGSLLRQHEREKYFISTKVGRVCKPVKRGEENWLPWVGGQNFEVSYY